MDRLGTRGAPGRTDFVPFVAKRRLDRYETLAPGKAISIKDRPMARILVVDDSITIRRQLRACLEEADHTVTEAEDGAQGLEAAKNAPFDLIIVDVTMPVMGGTEMLEGLRRIEACRAVPVFVLTTESSKEMVARGKALGATAWIVKPLRPDLLLEGISQVLGETAAAETA